MSTSVRIAIAYVLGCMGAMFLFLTGIVWLFDHSLAVKEPMGLILFLLGVSAMLFMQNELQTASPRISARGYQIRCKMHWIRNRVKRELDFNQKIQAGVVLPRFRKKRR